MKWKKEYNIGVEPIDEQHKKLAEMIGQFQSSMPSKEKNKQMGDTLKFLVSYTNQHFTAEEELMQRIDFPHYTYHKELHGKLIGDITAVLIKIKKGESFQVADLTDFLTGWLINHILDEDKKIGGFIIQHQQVEDQRVEPADVEPSLDIKTKLIKLKKLYDQELINKENFETKKKEIMNKYCSGRDVKNNYDIEERLEVLNSLKKKELISTEEATLFKIELFKKLDLPEKLGALVNIEDKLKYLKSLLQDDLISEKEFENLKSNALDHF